VNTQQLRLIAIIVAALIAAWAASEALSHRSDTTVAAFSLPKVSAKTTDTVTIWHGVDSVALVRHDSTWVVNGQPALASSVADLFEALRDSLKPELAAESPSSFARMGVDSAGTHLLRVVASGTAQVRLMVGVPGPTGDAAYVRVPGSARVYLWPGRLGSVVQRRVDDWRDRQIVAVVPDSVGAIEITRGRDRIALRRRGTHWAFGTGRAADSAAVGRVLDHFRSVQAAGFASARQLDSLRFDHPRRRVVLRTGTGRELAALAFDSMPSGFFARAVAGGPVYRLDFWQADELTPTAAALGPPSAPAPAPKPRAHPKKPASH
jgi:hypothetical protein